MILEEIDLIFTKYLKSNIAYEGITKIETYSFPDKIKSFNIVNVSKNKIEKNTSVVLEFLKQYPKTTQKNIIENLNISKRTIERIISLLKEGDYIERVENNRSRF